MIKIIKKMFILLVFVFLNCSTAIIKDTITYHSAVWDISILQLDMDIDKIQTDGTSVVSKSIRDINSPIKEICDYSSSGGNVGFNNKITASSSGSRTGRSISTSVSFESSITTSSPIDDFIVMEISVRNVSRSIQGFDFERVRLLFDESVSRPYILLSPEIIPTNRSFYYTIKPDDKVSRKLVFVHKKGSLPYSVVYDSINNGMIADKLSFQLNTAKQ